MDKLVGFVSEAGDSVVFLDETIKSLGVISGEKYVVGCGGSPLTEVNGLEYAEFEISKTGDIPHLAFDEFYTGDGEFRWLIKNQEDITQVVVGNDEGNITYHLTANQKVSVSIVAGDLYIEIK